MSRPPPRPSSLRTTLKMSSRSSQTPALRGVLTTANSNLQKRVQVSHELHQVQHSCAPLVSNVTVRLSNASGSLYMLQTLKDPLPKWPLDFCCLHSGHGQFSNLFGVLLRCIRMSADQSPTMCPCIGAVSTYWCSIVVTMLPLVPKHGAVFNFVYFGTLEESQNASQALHNGCLSTMDVFQQEASSPVCLAHSKVQQKQISNATKHADRKSVSSRRS